MASIASTEEEVLERWLEGAEQFLQRAWPPINNGLPFLFGSDDYVALVRMDAPIVTLFLSSDEGRATAQSLRTVGRYLPMTWTMINYLVKSLAERLHYTAVIETFVPGGGEGTDLPLSSSNPWGIASIPVLAHPGELATPQV